MRTKLTVVAILAIAIGALFLPLPWPDELLETHLVHSIDIATRPERVFAFVTMPANWPRWHPQSRSVSGVVDKTPSPGEQTVEEFEIAGRRGRATWTSVAVDAPRRWEIEGRTEGSGGAHIVYTLTPTVSGTHFQRNIVYRGDNLMFALANALKIEAVMDADSTEALRRLKLAVEALPPREN
jgi:uncharacterized protein YndB with AHSA1/START domain